MKKELKIAIGFSIIAIIATVETNLPIFKNDMNVYWYLGKQTVSDFSWFFAEWTVLFALLLCIVNLLTPHSYARIIMDNWLWLAWCKLIDEFIKPIWHPIQNYELGVIAIIILITLSRLFKKWQTRKKEKY